MTKLEFIEKLGQDFPEGIITHDEKTMQQWLLENLDTYAMEFLKECLPEKTEFECAGHQYNDGFSECKRITLNNANNKQDEK